MKAILLILITFSLSYAGFTRSNDMVTDSTTSLVWQDDVTPTTMSWQNAIDYCEASTLGSQSDWRLPNINELTSIVKDTDSHTSISNVFGNTTSNHYWSSTTKASDIGRAWWVSFDFGYDSSDDKTDRNYVRCVRGGQ
ncbi:MAG: hypothetical protein ACI9TV_001740 [Sulfurimonas sp.]|jgi:hypothetical protein|uniref:Lcl C-terminal domain-containing protein n=1 Tax=Sulfurimonas sp. TaxID=2022749 RepID=UPI0039E2FCCA